MLHCLHTSKQTRLITHQFDSSKPTTFPAEHENKHDKIRTSRPSPKFKLGTLRVISITAVSICSIALDTKARSMFADPPSSSIYFLSESDTVTTVRGSNAGGGETFCTRPDRPWCPSSLLQNRYRVSLPGVKRPGRGVNHPPPSNAEVKERVELYLYSPSGPSWPLPERTFYMLYMQSDTYSGNYGESEM